MPNQKKFVYCSVKSGVLEVGDQDTVSVQKRTFARASYPYGLFYFIATKNMKFKERRDERYISLTLENESLVVKTFIKKPKIKFGLLGKVFDRLGNIDIEVIGYEGFYRLNDLPSHFEELEESSNDDLMKYWNSIFSADYNYVERKFCLDSGSYSKTAFNIVEQKVNHQLLETVLKHDSCKNNIALKGKFNCVSELCGKFLDIDNSTICFVIVIGNELKIIDDSKLINNKVMNDLKLRRSGVFAAHWECYGNPIIVFDDLSWVELPKSYGMKRDAELFIECIQKIKSNIKSIPRKCLIESDIYCLTNLFDFEQGRYSTPYLLLSKNTNTVEPLDEEVMFSLEDQTFLIYERETYTFKKYNSDTDELIDSFTDEVEIFRPWGDNRISFWQFKIKDIENWIFPEFFKGFDVFKR